MNCGGGEGEAAKLGVVSTWSEREVVRLRTP